MASHRIGARVAGLSPEQLCAIIEAQAGASDAALRVAEEHAARLVEQPEWIVSEVLLSPDLAPHILAQLPTKAHAAKATLEALTYYVYALCFCTRQNARETIAWPMISGSRAALLIESQLLNSRNSTCVRCMMAPPRTASSEGVMLIPAIAKNSTTGYKNVSYIRGKKKFKADVRDGGKHVHLGYFNTADEAATAYARSEYGRADAAKLLQPRPAATPAGAEAIRQVEREGLALTASSSSNTGYKGVRHCPKQRGSKKYNLELPVYELSILTPEQMRNGRQPDI
ncbi:hypothetical protein EMIHUDRAFT_236957 [Emiliania huxleyi CCMP1516]|uniref:AP2/ERF domain-containing protein n=2 Tax=Emiliania huxleyi TaxID=2903 RepID=A0A0D3JRM8_EMIH1|nr:hypothetical protein EMIHUDRAFT_236957 [Emiliania huxleyi CCMP1516]EOD26163.1 hypothetical protein EMIHUDRAFT_236957 [Emiliania huxleyi CCMP1516]|eukprot:XP_005778592.1 hypothetical protein EMIHUDRAFT_236957 [Emiliania huxleyi CCMP1516]